MCACVTGLFAVGLFAVGHFAIGNFAVRTFRRTDTLPDGHLAIRIFRRKDTSPYDLLPYGNFAENYFFITLQTFGDYILFWQ